MTCKYCDGEGFLRDYDGSFKKDCLVCNGLGVIKGDRSNIVAVADDIEALIIDRLDINSITKVIKVLSNRHIHPELKLDINKKG